MSTIRWSSAARAEAVAEITSKSGRPSVDVLRSTYIAWSIWLIGLGIGLIL